MKQISPFASPDEVFDVLRHRRPPVTFYDLVMCGVDAEMATSDYGRVQLLH